MDIDDESLRALWQRQQPPAELVRDVAASVVRHRRYDRARLALEIALTAAGITLLTWPAADGTLSPAQWLLIPFFAVFLVISWAVVLRQRPDQQAAASEAVSVYARIRKLQLRQRLRHLKLAAVSGYVLFAYAGASLALSYLIGTTQWQQAGIRVFVWATVWAIGTWWFVGPRRLMILSEYRRMARLSVHG